MLLLSLIASAIAVALWKLIWRVYHEFTSPLRHLPGPKATSLIYGNMGDIWETQSCFLQEKWVEEYGNTLRYKGFFCTDGLLTVDAYAISHILAHNSDYQKPLYVRHGLAKILGNGKIIETHHGKLFLRYVRIIGSDGSQNPAFGPVQIRALTSIFFAKAIRLRDVLTSEISNNPAANTTGARIDIVPWLTKAALDVIGLAGFNYNIDALNANEIPNELNEAISTVIAIPKFGILNALQACIPLLCLIASANHILAHYKLSLFAQRAMQRIARELLMSAKAAARAGAKETGEIDKSSIHGRDLFSQLVKANMATDIPKSQRLSDEDVLAQFATFLAAGHESTSTATTWAFHQLALAPEIQIKLREELISVDTETLSMDDLMALPYLDAVVKETLRTNPPVMHAARTAMRDDVIPVKRPFTDKRGVVQDQIRITKGDLIFIPILAMNSSKELWGPDAHEFKPERWENVPEAVSDIPGVWSHLLSFLGGPRACIGYRFAVVEMKALLFTLVRAFEFELAVPASDIGKHWVIVQRPILRGDPTKKPQLPLLLKLYQRE
ncbi:cytochrome P450 [Melanogaster broomeanus]|nr:cytochrome P450 [Melanogaster broomeanus]